MIPLGPRQYVEGTFEIVDDAGNLALVQEGSAKYVVDENTLTAVVTGSNPFNVSVDWKAAGASEGEFQADANLGDGIELIRSTKEDFVCSPAKASAVRGTFGPVQTRP